jgi:ABC-type multidrug transport system ATPase subunit
MNRDRTDAPAVLEARGLALRYGSSGRGVEGVSLTVHGGEVYGLVGPNGSGKSTLLRVLSTMIEPGEGSFRVAGLDGVREKRRVRARVGLAVDRAAHYGDLSGRANAFLFARAYGMPEKAAHAEIAQLFEHFGLAPFADDRAKTYSYGMSKKLALAQAMAQGPELLLLDEPSLGLDYTSQLALHEKVRSLAASGAAILLASNQVDEVEALCDRVMFLSGGAAIAEGTPEELTAQLRGSLRIETTLRSPVGYGPLLEVEGVERVVPDGKNLVVHCEDREGIVAAVVDGIGRSGGDIADLSVKRPNLEDVFVKLTGEALKGDNAGV